MSDYLTFEDVAGELGCTLKKVRTLVVENRTLKATRITKNGLVLDSCGLDGHFPYDINFCCHLDDNGEITSDVYGGDSTGQTILLKTLDVGALRIARADIENFRIDHSEQTATPAPEVTETVAQRRARWLAMFEIEEKREKRGALQRVADSEGVDRSNMQKGIDKARAIRTEQNRAGFFVSQLVQDGKR